jgi:hypothetical protein
MVLPYLRRRLPTVTDGSEWTTAAGSDEGKHSRTKSPKTKNYASGDDGTHERPNDYFEPSAAFNQVAKTVASNAAERSTDYSRDL